MPVTIDEPQISTLKFAGAPLLVKIDYTNHPRNNTMTLNTSTQKSPFGTFCDARQKILARIEGAEINNTAHERNTPSLTNKDIHQPAAKRKTTPTHYIAV